MRIHLYNSTTEKTRLVKNNFLTEYLTVDGYLREECNEQSPIIQIEVTNILTANYAWIVDWSKYYFIDRKDIVAYDNGKIIYRLYMTEDVLMSFKEDIKNLDVIVTRNRDVQTSTPLLIDDKLPAVIKPDEQVIRFDLSPTEDLTNLSYCFVLTMACTPNAVGTGTPVTPNSNQLTSLSILLTLEGLRDFVDIFFNNAQDFGDYFKLLFGNPVEAVISCRMFPIDIKNNIDIHLLQDLTKQIPYGKNKWSINHDCYAIVESRYITYKAGRMKFDTNMVTTSERLFLAYPPYTLIELYIPFYGYTEIEPHKVWDKTIDVKYIIDFVTGNANVILYDEADKYETPIYTYNCNLGVDVSLSSSNVAERTRALTMAGIKFATSLATIGIGAAMGGALGGAAAEGASKTSIKTAKITAATGSVNTAGSTTANVIQGLQQHINSGTPTNSALEWYNNTASNKDDYTLLFMHFNLFARFRTVVPSIPKNYNDILGLPCLENGKLSIFDGYTEVSGCHMENFPKATSEEIDTIERIIKSGFLCSSDFSLFMVDVQVIGHGQVIGTQPFVIKSNTNLTIRIVTDDYYELLQDNVTIENATLHQITNTENTYNLTIRHPLADVKMIIRPTPILYTVTVNAEHATIEKPDNVYAGETFEVKITSETGYWVEETPTIVNANIVSWNNVTGVLRFNNVTGNVTINCVTILNVLEVWEWIEGSTNSSGQQKLYQNLYSYTSNPFNQNLMFTSNGVLYNRLSTSYRSVGSIISGSLYSVGLFYGNTVAYDQHYVIDTPYHHEGFNKWYNTNYKQIIIHAPYNDTVRDFLQRGGRRIR